MSCEREGAPLTAGGGQTSIWEITVRQTFVLGVMKKSSAVNIDGVENTNFANNSTGMQGDVG
jgi:hypothetical protein